MAKASITVGTGVQIDGRVLAETGAVTLDGNSLSMFIIDNACLVPLPPSPPNVPPTPPTAPVNFRITSET